MALQGTLKDFGLADIFQLIGQQNKTGVLVVKNNEQEVRITFKDGNVVKADSTSREKKELLGNMLVRADVLSQQQLDQALDLQRRTLKRLGDILVELGFVEAGVLKEFTKLQTTETIYKLFLWTAGTYEFTQAEPGDVDAQGFEPIRGESVLMEGFRMVDEWPLIRKKISSYAMTFRIIRQVQATRKAEPAAPKSKEADFLDGIDEAFGAMAGDQAPPPADEDDKLGPNERLVFNLVQPGREVQKLIDLSRLGEFETCKALFNLIQEGYLDGIPAAPRAGSGLAEGGALEPRQVRGSRLNRVQQVLGYALAGLAGLALMWALGLTPSAMTSSRLRGVPAQQLRDAVGEVALERIRHALEVHKLRTGTYPETLDALVETGLLQRYETHQPYVRAFAYARDGKGYRLVRPYY
ncbi:MAG: DUF4388 domain-containing protein [Deltaproteobacteria bacterium]|nr:DUF4388 domain-containing protein [Deltaproteobacteria bacterium]